MAARWLLGDSFHPGGLALTRRLIDALALATDAIVLDVASGSGTSAFELARIRRCEVVGVDLSPESVAAAADGAAQAGLDDRIRFQVGDAEALPFPDGSFDGALCECSLCLFPAKEAALSEIARVLRPGARLALSDVTAIGERLPVELRTLRAWAACVADARPLEDVAAQAAQVGLETELLAREDHALSEFLDRIEARLHVARIVRQALPVELRDGATLGLELVDAARLALAEGILGYGVLVARRS